MPSNVQCVFQPIAALISCVGATECVGMYVCVYLYVREHILFFPGLSNSDLTMGSPQPQIFHLLRSGYAHRRCERRRDRGSCVCHAARLAGELGQDRDEWHFLPRECGEGLGEGVQGPGQAGEGGRGTRQLWICTRLVSGQGNGGMGVYVGVVHNNR